MHTSILEPVGAVVTDVALSDVDADTIADLVLLLAERGVAIFADQRIDDDEFTQFLRAFGDVVFTAGELPLAGHPDLNVISNVGRATPPRSVFHVDTSYVSTPPAYTALRAVTIPAQGGETLFTNQYRAYESLPEAVRTRLAGRTVRHVVTGVDPGDGQERQADHPVFWAHPVSGRTALYLSTPQRCVGISGMDDAEATATIDYLYTHSTSAGNTLRHQWAAGDVVMWDNRCVMHRADHGGVVGDRVMHRGMVTARASASTGR